MRIPSLSVLATLSAALPAVLSAAEPAAFLPPAPRSDLLTTISDAQSMLTQHRPTSNDQAGGLFALQVGAEGGVVVPRGTDSDVVLGAGASAWLPLIGRRMELRFNVPLARTDFDSASAVGVGDLGVRFDWAPWIPGPNGVLFSLDSTWDTATKDELGVGQHTIAPAATFIVPVAGGFAVAPGLEHRHGYHAEDVPDISRTTIHLHGVWTGSGALWAQVDPSLTFDHEADGSWFALDAEGGVALAPHLSAYVAPGIAFGDDRPYHTQVLAGLLATF